MRHTLDSASDANSPILILAHGAGGDMDSKTLLKLRDEFLSRGISVVRFNFLYKEQRRSLPDKMPVLMDTYRSVVEEVRAAQPERKIVCSGHSMGGRTASMLAAEGFAMDGLLLLAYPLHPAGKPEKLRDEHLPKISVPTLCLNGTLDELCIVELMEAVLPRLQPTWTMHWLAHADHSYHVKKASGRNDREVMSEVGEVASGWIATL